MLERAAPATDRATSMAGYTSTAATRTGSTARVMAWAARAPSSGSDLVAANDPQLRPVVFALKIAASARPLKVFAPSNAGQQERSGRSRSASDDRHRGLGRRTARGTLVLWRWASGTQPTHKENTMATTAWRPPEPRERPVFVAADNRRAYTLRALGCAGGTLAALWLVALVAGALSAGRLPAVPSPALGALEAAGLRDTARDSGESSSAGRAAEGAAGVPSAATGLDGAGQPATVTDPPDARFPRLAGRAPGPDPRVDSDHGARVGGETGPPTGDRGGGAAQPTTPPTPQPGRPTEPGTVAPAPSASPGGSRSPLYEPPVGGRSQEAPRANGPGDPSVATLGAARRPTEG